MKRYLRIYRAIVIANLQKALVYRADLFWGAVTTLSWTFLSIVTISIYSSQSLTIAGWTKPELLSLVGVFAVVSGIAYLFFLINFEEIAVCVNKGTLDSLLLKPVDSQFFASTRYLALYNGLRAVIGIFIIISNVRGVSLQSLMFFLFILVCSIAMLYSIWLLVVTLNFYSQRLSNVIGLMLTIFDEVGRTPSDTFRIASSWAFTFLLPFFMIVSFPVKALWNKLPLSFAFATFGSAVVLFVLSRLFWKFSLRHYTSASS